MLGDLIPILCGGRLRQFGSDKKYSGRNIICIAFSGEEMGLLGSKYFTENPGIELSKVNAMINLDMLGRMEEHLHAIDAGR